MKKSIFTAIFATSLMFSTSINARAEEKKYFGILIPVGPPDYRMFFDNLKEDKVEKFGPFTYHSGTIYDVPVVISVAPIDGPLMRSLSAQEMLHHYQIGAFLYPGTSGAHLPANSMRIGDIVLGADNINFGNFFMGKNGDLIGNEFGHEKSGASHYEELYLDPALLKPLACAAHRVATRTVLPDWLNPHHPRVNPDIFYYGIQGTSTMWLSNQTFIEKINKIFHVIDEDGDWYSNLIATVYNIPFIEVSTISDSIFSLPETDRGIPVPPKSSKDKANIIAQRISNDIILDLIKNYGKKILLGKYKTPTTSPYEYSYFKNPKNPGPLLEIDQCK